MMKSYQKYAWSDPPVLLFFFFFFACVHRTPLIWSPAICWTKLSWLLQPGGKNANRWPFPLALQAAAEFRELLIHLNRKQTFQTAGSGSSLTPGARTTLTSIFSPWRKNNCRVKALCPHFESNDFRHSLVRVYGKVFSCFCKLKYKFYSKSRAKQATIWTGGVATEWDTECYLPSDVATDIEITSWHSWGFFLQSLHNYRLFFRRDISSPLPDSDNV